MSAESARTAVILLAMGGPETLDDIPRYLRNIFSDRTLIQLPGGALFQGLFARLISRIRSAKVMRNYSLIGGRSPLMQWTRIQGEHIVAELGRQGIECGMYVGMRYVEPTIGEAIDRAYADGYRRLVFLPMYPQYCLATTGSSFKEVERSVRKYRDVETVFIKDFHNDEGYLALLRAYIDHTLAADELLLFSAHAVPQSFPDGGDPYVDQVKKTARLAAGSRPYQLSFQSRTGPVTWVGPDTVEETKRLAVLEKRKLLIVPIAFVCDHIETLFELDIELKMLVGDGAERIRRTPMFNDDPRFGAALARLVRERLN